jgi:hypothetical protein
VAHNCGNGFDIYDELNPDHSVYANVGYLYPFNYTLSNCTWYANEVGIYTGTGANHRTLSEYGREIYEPDGRLTFDNNIFAENQHSIMLASNNNIERSLFVANAELGNPAISNQTMIHMYDGAGVIRDDSHIVGFNTSNSTMMSFAGASFTYGNFRLYDVTKANDVVFNGTPGKNGPIRRNATIYDKDGSLSGAPGTLVVNNNFFLIGGETVPTGWTDMLRSPRRYVNTRLFQHLDDAPWALPVRFPNVRVTRTKPQTTERSIHYTILEPILPFIMNDQDLLYTYDLTPEGQTLNSILPTQHRMIGFMLANAAEANDFVIVRFEELGALNGLVVDMSSEKRVYNNQPDLTVTRRYSLSDLKNYPTSAYFIDGSYLYIKAVATGDFAQFYNIKWNPTRGRAADNGEDVKEDKLSVDVADVLYPNPVSSKLFVKGLSGGEALQVIDVSGRLILSTTYKNSLDVSQLKSGMYILRVNDKSYRFIKEWSFAHHIDQWIRRFIFKT